MMICPLCHGALGWEIRERMGEEIVDAEIRCPSCGILAAVMDGIGVFLPGDAPRSGSEGPALPGTPEPPTAPGMGPEFQKAVDESMGWIVDRLRTKADTVLELSARSGELSRRLISELGARPILSGPELETLRGLRDRWGRQGGPERWDGVVFEPHSMPFSHRSVGAAVSELGVQGVPGPLVVLRELRRVVSGPIYVVAAFLEARGGTNHDAVRESGNEAMFFEESCLEMFRKARWKPRIEQLRSVRVDAPQRASGPQGPSPGFPRESAQFRVGVLAAE